MCKYIILQIYHFQKLLHVTDEINFLRIILDEAYRYNHYEFSRFFFCLLLSNRLENNQFKFVVFVTTLVQTNSIEKLQSKVTRHLRLRPNPLYVYDRIPSTFTTESPLRPSVERSLRARKFRCKVYVYVYVYDNVYDLQ